MNNFEFYSPTKVIFGKGTENNVGKELKAWGGTKVMLHFGGKSARTSHGKCLSHIYDRGNRTKISCQL